MAEDGEESHQKVGGERTSPPPITSANIELSQLANEVHLARPTLKEMVATEVLKLFSISLRGTLLFAAALVIVDASFIGFKIITPDQRLMTERVVMAFVSATVVQVGAAIGAIVFAVFKSGPE
jgi:hypothetical protein